MRTKTLQKDNLKIEGWVNVRIARADCEEGRQMEQEIKRRQLAGENVRELINEFNNRYMVREMHFKNIIPTVGRARLAAALIGAISGVDEVEVNKSALGTGTTTPANGDTTLDTETFRKDIASLSQSQNIFYGTAFYLASDTSGTFYEHGIFIDGTASADTGVLLSRVLLNAPTGIAKSGTETLTIEHQITIT